MRAAAALLEVVKRVDLAGHFEIVAIDWVVPALDVDRSRKAGEPELADDARPVGIAEARRAHLHERDLAEHAVLANDIPAHGGVFAMDMEKLRRPFADLRDRV